MTKIDSNTLLQRIWTKPMLAIASLTISAGLIPSAKANEASQLDYRVQIDTSALAGRSYSLKFSYIDNTNISFTFDNFIFKNGAPTGGPVPDPNLDSYVNGSIQNEGALYFGPADISSIYFGFSPGNSNFTQGFSSTTTEISFDVHCNLYTNEYSKPLQNIFSIGLVDNSTSLPIGTNAPDQISLINQYIGLRTTPDDLYAYKSTNPEGVTSSVYANDAFTNESAPVTVSVTAVPEPSSYAMIGTGAAGMAALIRRRKSAAKRPA